MNKLFIFLVLSLFSLNCYGAGLDADTNLLMHMDGSDDGTTFPDSSLTNNKGNADVTATVTTETTGPKWGTASALFDGDSGFLTYDDEADWDVCGSNSDDWTIDAWIYRTTTGNMTICSQVSAGAPWYWWRFVTDNANGLLFEAWDNGAEIIIVGWTIDAISQDAWHHVAMCKVANKYGVYLDGTQIGYTLDNDTTTVASTLNIGASGILAARHTGLIDELRIQNSNIFGADPNDTPDDTITVPTEAYSEVVTNVGQIIMIQ